MYSTFLSPRLGLEARLARRSHRKARATVYGARIQDKKTQGMSPIVYIALHEYMLINLTRFGVGKFSTQLNFSKMTGFNKSRFQGFVIPPSGCGVSSLNLESNF